MLNDAEEAVLGGFIDFLLPSTFVHAHGAITGLAIVAPVSLVQYLPGSDRCLTQER